MAIEEWKEIGNGDEHGNLEKPLMKREEEEEEDSSRNYENGRSIHMVYLSTFVAVCGSFQFGSCVSLNSHLLFPTFRSGFYDLSFLTFDFISF